MAGSYCEVCKVEATLKCNGCNNNVYYCGVDHQKKHWKLHKIECVPYEEAFTQNLDRFLRATRDIKMGSIIFVEAPLIFGPKWNLNEEEQNIPIFPCVGCFTPVRIGGNKCEICSWPACSSSCPGLTNPLIHQIECPILSFGSGPSYNNSSAKELLDYYRSDTLLTLKCLALQRKFPKKWERLMKMQSHEEDRKGTEYYEEADKRVVSYLKRNFLDLIKIIEAKTSKVIFPNNSEEILHKICGIIEVNFMMIDMPNGQEIMGVYSNGSLMEHSCVPNCVYTFDVTNGFKIIVRAGKDIKKGDHLKTMYTHTLWGTEMRRDHLKATKYFSCTCERCCDPTELGTYLSALKCIGSELSLCGGFQLPTDPISDLTDWCCNKCPVKLDAEYHNFLMSEISAEVDSITIAKQGTVRELEQLIDKLSQLLHANHYHLFALKHSLIQLYGHCPGYLPEQLSEQLLEKKITMCKEMLDIVDILDPNSVRLSLYTGIILYELHLATIQLYERKLKSSNCEREIILLKFIDAKNYLERSKRILIVESNTLAGKKLIENIEKSIENVNILFRENDFALE